MIFTQIQGLNFKEKRVFLRADFNVPIENGSILQDFKLKATQKTIDFILKAGGKIILGTHIGRPEAASRTNFYDEALSTQILMPWFKNKGYDIEYQQDLLKAAELSHTKHSTLLLLENLRFFNGEKDVNLNFAEILASTADIYINEAFGVIHREDTSVTLLPKLFDKNNRSFGFLIDSELQNLNKIRNNKSDNFILVLGGIKLKDKLPLIKKFIQDHERSKLKSILIGGAMGLAFLPIPNNDYLKFDDETLNAADQIKQMAEVNKINLLLPCDQIIFKDDEVKTIKTEEITQDAKCIDIGAETVNKFSQEIKNAETIFCNGTMGIYTESNAQCGTQKTLQAIANSKAFKVIGGGDATAATCLFGLEDQMDFLSTGGGATLKYLSCNDPEKDMPGLNAMIYE